MRVVELAVEFGTQALGGTRVWALATGCERRPPSLSPRSPRRSPASLAGGATAALWSVQTTFVASGLVMAVAIVPFARVIRHAARNGSRADVRAVEVVPYDPATCRAPPPPSDAVRPWPSGWPPPAPSSAARC